jgi:hypothetical protein
MTQAEPLSDVNKTAMCSAPRNSPPCHMHALEPSKVPCTCVCGVRMQLTWRLCLSPWYT